MIQVIVGTSRPGSNTRKLAVQIGEIYATQVNVPVNVLDLATLPPAVFAPGAYADKPADFAPFSKAIIESDGLVFVVPEYNGSLPGVLKHFIDCWKYPESFERRPVCYVGISSAGSGGLRPIEHLAQIMAYRNTFQFPERVFLTGIGDLMDPTTEKLKDPALAARLEKQARGFVEFIRRLKPI